MNAVKMISNRNRELVEGLSIVMTVLNGLGGSGERDIAVADWFARSHRTLQQQFVKVVILPILKNLDVAYTSGFVDGRNQAAAAMAHKMLAALDEQDTYLPLI